MLLMTVIHRRSHRGMDGNRIVRSLEKHGHTAVLHQAFALLFLRSLGSLNCPIFHYDYADWCSLEKRE